MRFWRVQEPEEISPDTNSRFGRIPFTEGIGYLHKSTSWSPENLTEFHENPVSRIPPVSSTGLGVKLFADNEPQAVNVILSAPVELPASPSLSDGKSQYFVLRVLPVGIALTTF